MTADEAISADELATVSELAAAHHLGESTVWLLIRRHDLSRYRVPALGKKTLIRRADFERARSQPVLMGRPPKQR